ncbi:MAG: pilus assembly protein TadG-related protein [Hyphomonas sp.]|uniref:TadE/TadG family type IV pilus assembly protein n=1 Tax=Hyphomonas sp. TaxID=87 RepID=UPI003528A2D6
MADFRKKIIRQKAGFARNQRGNVTIISAVSMFPILAISGFALDFRTTQNRKDDVQAALDASVLAAARALQQGEKIEDVIQDVADVMTKITNDQQMGLTCRADGVVIPNTKASVFARYECQQDTSLSGMMGVEEMSFHVEARAVYGTITDGCILALGPVAPEGIRVSGSADVNTDGCSVVSNVRGPYSVTVSGSGKLEASCVHAAGDIGDLGAITTTVCPSPVPNDGRIRDPYEDIEVTANVSAMPCQKAEKINKTTYRLPAGRYCGTDVKMNDTVLLDDGGVYYFDGVDIDLHSSGASLTGTNVTLVFMNGGEFSNANGGTVNLSAPTEGYWTGILMYGDRDTTPPFADMKISGNIASTLTGALYFPETDIEFRGTSDATDGCTQIVARSVDFGGDSNLRSKCEFTGVRAFGPNKNIYLEL